MAAYNSNNKNSLGELEVDCASDRVLLQLVLRETFLVERHLGVVVFLAQEALQVSVHSFGVLHGLKHTKMTDCQPTQRSERFVSVVNSRTIPRAPSPKSLSFSLRQTVVGVFLLDSLRKRKTDTELNPDV